MSRAAAVPVITRRQAGRPGAAAPLARAAGRGGVMAVLMTLSLVLVAEGRPGDLDPTFGMGGTVTTAFGEFDAVNALILQPNGMLVAAGSACPGDPTNFCDFGLARYLPDGRLDPTFGVGGKVTTTFGASDLVSALVLQPDGKLVAAGRGGNDVTLEHDFGLARYLPDGRLDPTFGVGGKVTTTFGVLDEAFALVLQPDGKLVAAGNADQDFGLARYLSDGSPDPTFGVGGKVTTDFGGFDEAFALILQPDGKLVAAGGNALARYLPDGRLDPTFGVGGTVTPGFGVLALVLQPDGKLVAAGRDCSGEPVSICGFALARYRSEGRLDPTFGVGGKVFTDVGDIGDAFALVLQPDGKLVAAGRAESDFGLARYLPDGRLDPTFGTGGLVFTDFGGFDEAFALVLQPDGNLVAAGFSDVRGSADWALARYLSPPLMNDLVTFEPLDATFHFTPDPTGCPEGFVGTFRFEARLTNISARALSDLAVAVITVTQGNLLQNADGGPGGVGALLTVPQQDGFSEGVLRPDEFVDVPFIICLLQQEPFRLVVDVFGEAE